MWLTLQYNQLSYGMQFQGKHIRVDMATAPRKEGAAGTSNAAEYDRTRSIFLGNVPFDVEVWDFLFLFKVSRPHLLEMT